MRIVKEWNYNGWHYSLFQNQGRIILQIKAGYLSQSFRLHSSDVDQIIQKSKTSEFVEKTNRIFIEMSQNIRLLESWEEPADDQVII